MQINAAAVFQGQTAVATITQTNVLTAAQAAGAAGATGGATGRAGGSGASAGGATGAGGGGGLSATTIGIVGAVVGGGALVAATKVGGDEEPASRGPRGYSGASSGQLVWRFPGCARIHGMSGTLRIMIDSTSGAVAGTATIEGTSRVSSVKLRRRPSTGRHRSAQHAVRP